MEIIEKKEGVEGDGWEHLALFSTDGMWNILDYHIIEGSDTFKQDVSWQPVGFI